jgi:acyl-CoA synthetase (AMP-forming)/AMP-acid ligase II
MPFVRYNYIGGEPLPLELAEAWFDCVPNALISNVYAPSEATMLCMGYNLSRNKKENRAHNGIVPFGTPWKNTTTIIVNEKLQVVKEGETGELCFAGNNVMSGYLNKPSHNKKVLFDKEVDGMVRRFYRSGDMAFLKEGIYYTCGRIDLQVKIQGHKVELEEIEYESRKILQNPDIYALTGKTPKGTQEIYLVIKSAEKDEILLREKLAEKLAPYMIPGSIKFVDQLAYNDNGKIDRGALKALFQ